MFTPPAEVEAVATAFSSLFIRSNWRRAQALLCGTLLAPANNVLTAALRVLGLAIDPGFQDYHRLLITRLRLDAALYEPAPVRAASQKGRPRRKGLRLPTLAKRLTEPDTIWSRVRVRWYGGAWRWLEVASDAALWYHSGLPPVALRSVIIRDPKGKFEPQSLLSRGPDLPAVKIVGAFVRRWAMKVTFQEARAHLGIEGQRQWNDLAIARSTPLRPALFSLVRLLVHRQAG